MGRAEPGRYAVAVLTPAELETIWLSLRIAAVGVVCITPPGVILAWWLAQPSRGRAGAAVRVVVQALVLLPLVLPPVVVGWGLLMLLGRNGVIGRWLHDTWGWTIAFTTEAAALAAAIVALPLLVRPAQVAFEGVDRRLGEAARTLGASRLDALRSVTLPLALPGILAGVLLAFARALGEFGATITFAGNTPGETRTLPLAIYTAAQQADGDAMALRLVLISVALSLIAMIVSELLVRRARRRVGEGGRV